MASEKLSINNIVVEFKFQEDQPERQALGEQFEWIKFIPANATGKEYHYSPSDQPDYTVRNSALKGSIESVLTGLPEDPNFHPYHSSHPDRLGGYKGWIHKSVLGRNRLVMIGDMTITNAFSYVPLKDGSFDQQYGSIWDFARLFGASDTMLQARQDTTFLTSKKGIKSAFPAGSMKHAVIRFLAMGIVVVVYPWIEKIPGTNDYSTRNQDRAKWFYATLKDLKEGKIKLETVVEQYFANELFFKISAQRIAASEAKGERNTADTTAVMESAKSFVTTGAGKEIGVTVIIAGKKVDVGLMPQGRWTHTVNGKVERFQTLSSFGREDLVSYARRTGTVELKPA